MQDIRAMTIPVPIAGVLLVARDDHSDEAIHQDLHALLTVQEQLI